MLPRVSCQRRHRVGLSPIVSPLRFQSIQGEEITANVFFDVLLPEKALNMAKRRLSHRKQYRRAMASELSNDERKEIGLLGPHGRLALPNACRCGPPGDEQTYIPSTLRQLQTLVAKHIDACQHMADVRGELDQFLSSNLPKTGALVDYSVESLFL
ncbi:hypothetical protein Ae201684P_016860 [Aphanomyces euteiches]|uniref:Uncharacterized protein n=1 Tax=Aphanomyces euteiches TaxID=100861 RepID=A0A6G0WMU2_9STRA|nr:hypothetical protein Ae201684_013633 [Aphanomyces euteiches]KAH9094248.1 hypothetical protein Ae201684P_016860 [Aphanomyces euteiches]